MADRISPLLPDSRDGSDTSSVRDSGRRLADRLFVLLAFLLFGATAAVVLWQNSRLTILWDLSYILENASRMAAGQRPYRDFPFPYAPLTFLTHGKQLFERRHRRRIMSGGPHLELASALTTLVGGSRPPLRSLELF